MRKTFLTLVAIAATAAITPANAATHTASAAKPALTAKVKKTTTKMTSHAVTPHKVALKPSAKTSPMKTASHMTLSTKAGTKAWTTKSGKVVHYDCSKAGNKTKQACSK